MTDRNSEPMLISGMRRFPTGDVRHIPGGGIGMGGTSTVGFIHELDRWLARRDAEVAAKAAADAWDEGVEYAKKQLEILRQNELRWLERFPDLTNKEVQPCFDAINAAGTMTYNEYNGHIGASTLFGAIDMLTVSPEMPDGEGGVFEADDDPNPYRASSLGAENPETGGGS